MNRLLGSLQFRAHRLWRAQRVRLERPVLSRADILATLGRLKPVPRRAIMVHSSLNACGYIQGGARTVIAALRDWCAGCTLAMPSHSYCYPRTDGACPVFDASRSPSVIGAISDTFWRMPGARRSLHPTHSIACIGPDAEALIAGHDLCDTPCGHGTPYERLLEMDGGVLMFGASMDAYTLFHTAEDAACVPYLYEPVPYQLKLTRGDHAVYDFTMRRQDMRVRRRFAGTAEWLQTRGLLRPQSCGRGELLWMPHAAAVHSALVQTLKEDPWFLVAAEARPH